MRIKTLTKANERSPFGWCIDENSNEAPDKREQNMILIVRGYRLNRLSYSAIAEKFSTAGYMTRTGKAKFNESMIKRINDAETVDERSPLGWKINDEGNEVPCEQEQKLIQLVRDYRRQGFTYQVIANDLTESEFTTRTGKLKFSKSAIKRINNAETVNERNDRLNLEFEEAPLGWQWVDGELVKHEGEYKVIERMRKLRDLGVTYKEIVRTLNQMSKTKIDTLDNAIFEESN